MLQIYIGRAHLQTDAAFAHLHRGGEGRVHNKVTERPAENAPAPFFGVLSLCLSRACLGKMMAFSIKWQRKKTRFPVPIPEVGIRSETPAQKTSSFSTFLLYLSRACLGKMITSSSNNDNEKAQKTARFSA